MLRRARAVHAQDSPVRRGRATAGTGAGGGRRWRPARPGPPAWPRCDRRRRRNDPPPSRRRAVDDIYSAGRGARPVVVGERAGVIHRGDKDVVLHGMNWFRLKPVARAVRAFAVAAHRRRLPRAGGADFGFNALRVPLSPEEASTPGAPSSRGSTAARSTPAASTSTPCSQPPRVGMYLLWICTPARGPSRPPQADSPTGVRVRLRRRGRGSPTSRRSPSSPRNTRRW